MSKQRKILAKILAGAKNIAFSGQGKTYQIRQFMDLVERHNLNLQD